MVLSRYAWSQPSSPFLQHHVSVSSCEIELLTGYLSLLSGSSVIQRHRHIGCGMSLLYMESISLLSHILVIIAGVWTSSTHCRLENLSRGSHGSKLLTSASGSPPCPKIALACSRSDRAHRSSQHPPSQTSQTSPLLKAFTSEH